MSSLEQRVGRIATADLGVLAAFRDRTGWALRDEGNGSGFHWLRVPAADEDLFRKLPLVGRWSMDSEYRLIRDGRLVAEALLPADSWQTLAAVIAITPPLRGAPGMPPPAVSFRLEPDAEMQPAGALLCGLADFASWADSALAPRFAGLRFAAAEDGRVFVTGHPLPAIAGASFYPIGKLWLPCGWKLPDHTWPELLEGVLKLGRNRVALFHPDGCHEKLDEENLVPATRAAVRTTESINRERSER
ncbi:hypothetical protein [Luteolibacter soli]|uniref:MoxR-vWA-beta-propeller ternary system domain-containing protein n=1 Tax=Luteolibacter soli TaxID=3135280 RepID=A0ABU9AWS0_9BACT